MVLALTVATLAGCSGKDPKPAGNDAGNAGQNVTAQPTDTVNATPTTEPTKEPTPVPATPTPTEVPKPEGKTYENGFTSPVAGDKTDFDKAALSGDSFTVVTSPEEFINAVRPGAKIAFAPGRYNLSEYTQKVWDDPANESAKFEGVLSITEWTELVSCFDGVELKIKGVDDLLITGGSEQNTDTEIVIDPRYAAVLRLDRCSNVDIANLTIGHTDMGDCSGNVIDLYGSNDICFYNMDIYGCGVYGIGATNGSADIHVYSSTIHDCSYGPITFDWGMGVFELVECTLTNAGWISYSPTAYSRLIFDRCTLGDWETSSLMFRDDVECLDCTLGEMVGEYPDIEEPGPGTPYWHLEAFDPSSFDFDSMEEAYDDEYIAAKADYDYYSYWSGYMKVNPYTGDTFYMPGYDLVADEPVEYSCGFRLPDADDADGKPEFYLTIGDNYYQGTWYYDSAYSAVLVFNDNEEYGMLQGANAYVSVYRDLDTEHSHPWLMMQIVKDVIWFY